MIISQYHYPLKRVISAEANCIPIILPTFGQVAQSPTRKPLFFFGNQFDIIDMYAGKHNEVKSPINIESM